MGQGEGDYDRSETSLPNDGEEFGFDESGEFRPDAAASRVWFGRIEVRDLEPDLRPVYAKQKVDGLAVSVKTIRTTDLVDEMPAAPKILYHQIGGRLFDIVLAQCDSHLFDSGPSDLRRVEDVVADR